MGRDSHRTALRRVNRAVCEALENRVLLSNPIVLDPLPRDQRDNYIAPTSGSANLSNVPAGHFEWEYDQQRLVYRLDQPVLGLDNQTHVLTALYKSILVENGPAYPLEDVPVTVGVGFWGMTQHALTLDSADNGATWTGSDGSVTITLDTDPVYTSYHRLRADAASGSATWLFNWDGYDGDLSTASKELFSGDGDDYRLIDLGSPQFSRSHTAGDVIAPPAISAPVFSADGKTATFTFGSDPLPDGNYESILASAGITDITGTLNLDGNLVVAGEQDFIYSFFVRAGDANHDRVVNIDDFGVIDANRYRADAAGFFNGDFNYDGAIDSLDYDIINRTYGTVLPLPPTTPGQPIAYARRDPITDANEVVLEWVPVTGVTDLDGYGLWRSTDGGVTFTLHAFVEGGGTSSYVDQDLGDGAKYTYRMRAHSTSQGYSHTTEKVSSVTNLPAPSDLFATNITADGVTLNWTDTTTNETGFEILKIDPYGAETIIPVDPSAAGVTGPMSFRVEGLDSDATYQFRVRAVVAGVQESAWTLTLSVTTLPSGIIPPSGLWVEEPWTSSPNLNWLDNSTDETGFRIEVSTDNFLNDVAIAGAVAAGITAFPLQTLEPNTTYYFRVRALRGGEVSAPSNVVSLTTGSFLAAPSELTATLVQDTGVELRWRDNSEGEYYFYIYVSIDGAPFEYAAYAPANATSFTYNGADATSYQFFVLATGSSGDSHPSNIASVTTGSFAGPTSLVAVARDGNQIELNWSDNSSGEELFEIERKEEGGVWGGLLNVPANQTQYTDPSTVPGNTYTYRVRAYRSGPPVITDWSNEASATAAAIAPPSNLTAVAVSTSEINLSWEDNSAGESGFEIEISPDNDESFFPLAITPPNARHFSVIGLAADQTYYFKVRALRDESQSNWSSSASARTDDIPGEDDDTDARVEELGTVTPSVSEENTQWFGQSFEPGTYRVMYAGGNLNIQDGNDGWWGSGEYAHYSVAPSGTALPIMLFEHAEDVAPGMAGQGTSFLHAGGPLGVRFVDDPYWDNIGGGLSWKLQRYHPPEPPPPPEELPVVSLAVDPQHTVATEGADDHIELVFSRAPLADGSKPAVTVKYTLAGTANPPGEADPDYTGPTGGSGFGGEYTITIASGADDARLTIEAEPDELEELSESAIASLRSTGTYILSGQRTAEGTIVEQIIDLDVDSDNNNGFLVPDRSLAEEMLEGAPEGAKNVFANTGDRDRDRVPDFADFDGVISTAESFQFAPVILSLGDGVVSAPDISITLEYESSDPSQISTTGTGSPSDPTIYTPAPGFLRLWTKPASEARDIQDYIASGRPYTLDDLGLTDVAAPIFYLEAVRASPTPLRIEVHISAAGLPSSRGDHVHVRAVRRSQPTLFAVEAFIPNTLGDSPNSNAMPAELDDVTWQVEPGPGNPGWYTLTDFPALYQTQGPQQATVFGTDNRAQVFQRGTYRLRSELSVPIEATEIGSVIGPASTYIRTTAGASHQATMVYQWVQVPGIGWVKGNFILPATIDTRTAVPIEAHGIVNRPLETEFTISAAASYPFNPLAPELDWSFQLRLRTTADRETTYVTLSGSHDQFPAYVAYSRLDQSGIEYSFLPTSSGPSMWNLGIARTSMEVSWIV